MVTEKLVSRIDKVKVYAAGATVTRIAQLELIAAELSTEVEIAGLPLALDDSSVRARVESVEGLSLMSVVPADIRIGLAVPPPTEVPNAPPDEELRAAAVRVQKMEDTIALIDREINLLYQLQVPDRPASETGKAPPASPTNARLALANFSDEQVRTRIQEKRENQEKLRLAKENLEDLQAKQAVASTARDAKPNELRKTAIVSLSYVGEVAVERIQIILEYFVPGARWTPTYICRLNSQENTATIAVRSLLCQRTGEDWSSVKLELSTANPISWCAIPELPSLRLGKAQPEIRKVGWRQPPVGAKILFEDFDRQKESLQTLNAVVKVSTQNIARLTPESKTTVKVSTQNITTTQSSSSRRSTSLISLNFSPFGNKLISIGYINPEDMKKAMIESRQSGRPLTEVLESITGRQLPPELLRQYKKQQLFELKILFGIECLDPEISQIQTNLLEDLFDSFIPEDICRRYRLVPLSKNKTSILVAMVNPDNLEALDDLNRILRPQGLTLQRIVITREDYEQLITQYLDEKAKKLAKQDAMERDGKLSLDADAFADSELVDAPEDEGMNLDNALGEAKSFPVVKTVNTILAKALSDGVSDIHVEPQEEFLRIRMRKDGVLQEPFPPLPKKVIPAITSRFKIIANMDVAERRQAQEGRFRRIFYGQTVDFWVKTVPTSYGEKIVISVQKLNSDADLFAYSLMRMGASEDRAKRGKLSIEQRQEVYLEILQKQKFVVNFNILEVLQQAIYNAQECLSFPLPPGGINVRKIAGSFDYAYSADGRIDIPSDGQFHSVALTSKTTNIAVRYIVVPRKDTNVFRIAQLRNPLSAPLLSGPADVYVDGEYILSTNIVTVPPKGQMELGLGVEQAIKVSRNTSYCEARSGETIVAFNEFRHQIKIEIKNHLSRDAKIEVRERLPIPQEGAKVEVQIERVSPEWKQYNQKERSAPIRGGYRWQVLVGAKKQKNLSVDYKIKTFVDNELIDGNRREY